jgi:hypothetical protein
MGVSWGSMLSNGKVPICDVQLALGLEMALWNTY